MADIDQIVPCILENSNNYLIKFTKFNNFDHIGIDIVDVSLIPTNPAVSLNSITAFRSIADIVKNYLLQHNVILYYYCDTTEIFRRNSNISPQHYRSMLFCSLFERYNSDDFFCKHIVIENLAYGNHYISSIAREYNETIFDAMAHEINNLK